MYDLLNDPGETKNLAYVAGWEELTEDMAIVLAKGWKAALPEGVTNYSDNPMAPPAYSWGPEGVPRRKLWHEVYGGMEEEGWEKAIEVRITSMRNR